MYTIECIRDKKKFFLWADKIDLDCWCVSMSPYVFQNFEDAEYVVKQVTSISNSNLTDVTIFKVN